MQNGTIESKEIRGVTAKSLIWLFGLLTSILISVMATYFSINNKMENLTRDNQIITESYKQTKDIQDAQIRQLNLQMQTIEIRLVRLETQSDNQKSSR